MSCRAAALLIAIFAVAGHDVAAQTKIYRCGNRYTNSDDIARAKGCLDVSVSPPRRAQGPTTMTPTEADAALAHQDAAPRTGGSLFESMGITLPPPPAKRELGPIDRWRYESCLRDAAKAPTEAGVRVAAGSCAREFGQ